MSGFSDCIVIVILFLGAW